MADSEAEADIPPIPGPVDTGSASSPPLYPPTKRLRSLVWEFFGYPKQPDGSVRDDGEPTCKLCNRKVIARSANTSNMIGHLRDRHKKEYATLKSKQVTNTDHCNLSCCCLIMFHSLVNGIIIVRRRRIHSTTNSCLVCVGKGRYTTHRHVVL